MEISTHGNISDEMKSAWVAFGEQVQEQLPKQCLLTHLDIFDRIASVLVFGQYPEEPAIAIVMLTVYSKRWGGNYNVLIHTVAADNPVLDLLELAMDNLDLVERVGPCGLDTANHVEKVLQDGLL